MATECTPYLLTTNEAQLLSSPTSSNQPRLSSDVSFPCLLLVLYSHARTTLQRDLYGRRFSLGCCMG